MTSSRISLYYWPKADIFVLFVLSLLLLSPFGWSKYLNFNGLYFAEPAIAFLLFYLFKRQSLRPLSLHCFSRLGYVLSLFVLFCLFLIGCIFHGELSAAYTDLRAQFILLSSFFVFYKMPAEYKSQSSFVLFLLSFLSVSFFVLYLVFYGKAGDSVKYVYPVMSFPPLALIPSMYGWVVAYFLALVLISFSAITSFYRGIWIVSVLVIMASFFSRFARGGMIKKSYSVLISFVFLVIFVNIYSGFLSDFISGYFGASDKAYAQSIGKWNNLTSYVSGDSAGDGDDLRLGYFGFIWDNFLSLIVPAGLGYKPLVYDVHSPLSSHYIDGNTIDSTLLYLFVHYGTIFSILLSSMFFYFFYSASIGVSLVHNIIRGSVFIVFIFYSSISAVFLSEISSAFFYGASFGWLCNRIYWESS